MNIGTLCGSNGAIDILGRTLGYGCDHLSCR
jgi:hypothetical protein